MKLRELFDKLTPGMLDAQVYVEVRTVLRNQKMVKIGEGVTYRELEKVEIQDDGSVTLVITE